MASHSYWPTDLDDVIPFDSEETRCNLFPPAEPLTRLITKFKTKKLRQWDREDIVDWVHHFCKMQRVDPALVNIAGFAVISADELANLSEDQFSYIDPIYGRDLYQALKSYKKCKTSGGRIVSEIRIITERPESPLCFYEQNQHDYQSDQYNPGLLTVDNSDHGSNYSYNYSTSPCRMMSNLSLDSSNSLSSNDTAFSYPSLNSDYSANYSSSNEYQNNCRTLSPCNFDLNSDDGDLADSLLSPTMAELTVEDLHILNSPDDEDPFSLTPDWDLISKDSHQQSGNLTSDTMRLTKCSGRSLLSPTPEFLTTCGRAIGITGQRHRHVSDTSSGSSSRNASPCKRKVPTKPKPARKEKGKKVWQFLLDLLQDENSNPSLIRWENEDEGIFRLVEHDAIAHKWGMRRDRGDLSYDYFARTMRYQYTTNMLESVPEKKLVYKFGPEVLEGLRQKRANS